MACQPALMAPEALLQASIISPVGSRIAAIAARARAKDDGGSADGAVPISCWSACATRSTMVLIDLAPLVQLVAPLQLSSPTPSQIYMQFLNSPPRKFICN